MKELEPNVLIVKIGYALFDIMAIKPHCNLALVSNSKRVAKLSELYANNIKLINEIVEANMPIEDIWNIISRNKEILFKNSDTLTVVYVSNYVKEPRANCITFKQGRSGVI